VVLDGIHLTGAWSAIIAMPSATYTAGQQVWLPGSPTITGVPNSTDGFDISISAYIMNTAATNQMHVSGTTVVPAGTSSGTFDNANLAEQSHSGSDLVFTTGIITTTAGGTYASMTQLLFSWD
jgi:hypothetical protein